MKINKATKESIKKVLFNTGFYKINGLINRCYILMYHMIPQEPTGLPGEVTKADFEKHIKHLSKNYNIISLEDFIFRVREKQSLRRCVVITFDDGFRDNYENAYPILKKYGVPATIFLLTGRIEDGKAPWFMQFRHSFMKTVLDEISFDYEDINFNLPLKSINDKKTSATKAMLYLQTLPDHKRIDMAKVIIEDLTVGEIDELQGVMLTWDQIREMSENGISFGAHTINHPVLSNLPSKEAENEIISSKRIIEEKIDKEIVHFAYPFGRTGQYNNQTIKILKENGFKCAVTTVLGPTDHREDLFQIKRCYQGPVRLHELYWEPYSLSVGSY
jgi:peptidoglycan/xylan/chitin deacetylase (PgdA/CDA1 family)